MRESAAFVREIGFLKVHVFSFSRRAGTPAYDMPDQIDEAEKARRSHRLQAEADAVRARVIAGMAGRPVEVLLEKPVNNTLFTGYTREYVPVLLKAPGQQTGRHRARGAGRVRRHALRRSSGRMSAAVFNQNAAAPSRAFRAGLFCAREY